MLNLFIEVLNTFCNFGFYSFHHHSKILFSVNILDFPGSSYESYEQPRQHHCSQRIFYHFPDEDELEAACGWHSNNCIQESKQGLRQKVYSAVVRGHREDGMSICAGDNVETVINKKDEMFWHHTISCKAVCILCSTELH